MPKILDSIKEKALAEAGRILLSEGYRALTVRRVAETLGIGVGTLYNYFPSKDHLVAGVMLDNWQGAVHAFEAEGKSGDAREVIRRLFSLVQTFSERYQTVWDQYAEQGESGRMRRQYHNVLVEQLAGYIAEALPSGAEDWLAAFLAELVLRFASDGRSAYEAIGEAVEKLLGR